MALQTEPKSTADADPKCVRTETAKTADVVAQCIQTYTPAPPHVHTRGLLTMSLMDPASYGMLKQMVGARNISAVYRMIG